MHANNGGEGSDNRSNERFFLVKGHPIPLSYASASTCLTTGILPGFSSLQKNSFTFTTTKRSLTFSTQPGRVMLALFVTSKTREWFPNVRNKDDKESMYFGGVRNGYSPSTPSLPQFFYPHIQQLEAFRSTCHQLTIKLLRCFAISFGLAPNYFADGTGQLFVSESRTQGYRPARGPITFALLSRPKRATTSGNYPFDSTYRLAFSYFTFPEKRWS